MYVLTFRIKNETIGGKSYQDRYDALHAALKKNNGLWYDTTSFYLMGSAESTSAIGARLVQGLNAQHDMLFVFDPEDMSACYFGNIGSLGALTGFFPKSKKLG